MSRTGIRHLSRRWLFVPAAIIIVVVAFFIYHRETEAPTGHGGTPPPAIPELTADEHAYYDYVGPRLHELVGETQVLADMGSKQSRNVLVLEKTYNRTTDLIDQIQTYEKDHGVPPRFQPAHEEMTSGITMIEQTMDQAKTDFFQFRWDKLQPLLATFEQGNQRLTHAASTIDHAGGGHLGTGATPTAQP
jgi:hypothetical protein